MQAPAQRVDELVGVGDRTEELEREVPLPRVRPVESWRRDRANGCDDPLHRVEHLGGRHDGDEGVSQAGHDEWVKGVRAVASVTG